MKMSNNCYDNLKWVALLLLPAIATFYASVADIWGLPYASQTVATITAIDTFLGAVLHASNSNYKKEQE